MLFPKFIFFLLFSVGSMKYFLKDNENSLIMINGKSYGSDLESMITPSRTFNVNGCKLEFEDEFCDNNGCSGMVKRFCSGILDKEIIWMRCTKAKLRSGSNQNPNKDVYKNI